MTYKTTAKKLITAYRAAQQGMSVPTGMWTYPRWSPEEFFRWFRKCLDEKISISGALPAARMNWRKLAPRYQMDLLMDARTVNDYYRRIRHSSSRNILRLPEMQAMYPHVNTQPREE